MKVVLLLLLLLPLSLFAQSPITLKGRVTDANNKPVEFANVTIAENNLASYTDTAGYFQFNLNPKQFPTATIRVSMVGKQTATRVIDAANYNKSLLFILNDLSLTLNEVVVSGQQKSSISNSSVVFDRQAIDQVQAYSLVDVLNNLPGKTSTAPDLQYRQNITLRTAASSDPTQQAINSMGVAVYIDGTRQSNDANMQNTNIGAAGGVRGAVLLNHKDPNTGNPTYDTPFSGLDIRNIPADNIESVEVVSGVASAKYTDLTDGAIIITRMAGKTDYNLTVRTNGNSTNTSLSKGYFLGKKAGALNININYLNSQQSPTNSLKNYGRVTGGTMWTTNVNRKIKNTFSTDFAYKIDNARFDPDDGSKEMMYTKESRVSFSNRTSFQVDNKWLNRASLNLSYDFGYSESMRQVYINGAPIAVADKDTTGIYAGYYTQGNFYSTDHIIGKPYNASGSFDLNSSFRTGNITHQLAYGASAYLSGNHGPGVIADPTLPFTNNVTYVSERPYNFDLQRPLFNFGFYAEDRVKFKVLNHVLNVDGGLRYDLQNGAPSLQPRINSSYQLSKHWSVKAAFGIATKAPPMAYRYPGPTYFDIPLINAYNSDPAKRLYLVYTRKVEHDNSFLKPSRSTQMEFGLSADYSFFNSSMYGYIKKNRDGFNSSSAYMPLYLPVYTFTPGQTPSYQTTGATKLYAGLYDSQVGNNVQSDNYGIEWFVSTHKIQAIQTSFSFNTSVAYSKYNNTGYTIQQANQTYIDLGYAAWYGIYPGNNYKNLAVTSRLNSDTHLPSLGFVLSVIMDVSWKNNMEYLGKSNYPVAYIDKNSNTVPIPVFDANNKDYNYLLLKADAETNTSDPPFAYASLSLRVAKEIRKRATISLYAYNFLDTKVKYYNPVTNSSKTYVSPVNVGAQVSFKF